ncbi:MAG: hypothetical protein J6M44_00600 [Butyrivibrio sp.]|nr:hypothetical protein [Butyrivibrio sp.]
MDVNIETSSVREEAREDKRKEDLKSIIWTIIGMMIFTVIMALAFRYIEYKLGILV